MIHNDTKNYSKSTRDFHCKLCDYSCSNMSNFNKHLQTKKHKKAEMIQNGTEKVLKTTHEPKCWSCECGRTYRYHSGYYRHKKTCNYKPAPVVEETKGGNAELKNMFINVVEENKELRRLLMKQQEQIGEIIPRIGNTTHTTNNTFNLQMFLHESCKDALNISDFIESLNIQIQDLEHTKKHGLCEGVANIFVNGLKQLGTYKRPIHCTDVKRETLYIKDNDQWGKEETSRERLKKSLYDLADKQRKAITEWEECHPDWESSEQGKQEWILLVKNVMGTLEENAFSENKIIKNIAREVKI